MSGDPPLLEVEDLTVQYRTAGGRINAVSAANLTIERQEFFGLVGESGCGKSTLARAILGGLSSNGEIVSGEIRLDGQRIDSLSESQLNQQVRWEAISLIPQGSMNSLNPLQRMRDQALEIAEVHSDMTPKAATAQFEELFDIVGLPPERIRDYPHQFSGGMKQRAIIALALFLEPDLIIADEPTTALDVIMQDQVFKYLDQIKEELNVSVLLITHDISLVFESCDRMGVMHSGQMAEVGEVEDLHRHPRHPYSILLQRAFPDVRHPERELVEIDEHPPTVHGDIDFCTFERRCPLAVDECRRAAPTLEPMAEAGHEVACFRREETAAFAEDMAGWTPTAPEEP